MKKLMGLVLAFIVWYIATYVIKLTIDYINIPYPHEVFINFFHLIKMGSTYDRISFTSHIIVSLKRLIIGLIVAITLGVHLGILLGLSKTSDHILGSMIYSLYPVPKAALLPILIIFFGLGDTTKIMLIVIIVIFPIIVKSKDAIKAIPKEVFYTAKTLTLSKITMYKDIIIPAILPHLLTSVRIGIGTSVAVLFLSESFSSQNGGLGYYISLQISANTLNMFTGIFTLSVIGYTLFLIVDLLENKLCKWV